MVMLTGVSSFVVTATVPLRPFWSKAIGVLLSPDRSVVCGSIGTLKFRPVAGNPLVLLS